MIEYLEANTRLLFGFDKTSPITWLKEPALAIQCLLKVYSSHLNWGSRLDSFDLLLNTTCPASLNKNLMIQSHERSIKQFSVAISMMTVSNQSHFPRFFLSPESYLIWILQIL